jgi:hypothetical protein
MGGTSETLRAKTETELKKKVEKWIIGAKASGLTDIRLGWDPDRVVKTKNGYEIGVWAHS